MPLRQTENELHSAGYLSNLFLQSIYPKEKPQPFSPR